MRHKKSQLIMVWLLPVIIVGGLFFPLLGYLVVAMMAFFIPLSFFRGRFWCWYLCPRGAFLDIVVGRVSLQRPIPKIIAQPWFRWAVLVTFMLFLSWRIVRSGGSAIAIGMIFVMACLMTTIIATAAGVATKQRCWCACCPMGTLQEYLGKRKKG